MTEDEVDLSPGALADRVEAALGKAEARLIELGLAPPKRTRAERRARKAGRRLPNDGARGQTADQIKAQRRAKARKTTRARRGKR